jgi:hypothetical protein
MLTQQHSITGSVDEDEQPNTSTTRHALYTPPISPTSTPGSPRPATAHTGRSAIISPPRLQADHDGQPPRAAAMAALAPAPGVGSQKPILLDVALLSGMLPRHGEPP